MNVDETAKLMAEKAIEKAVGGYGKAPKKESKKKKEEAKKEQPE